MRRTTAALLALFLLAFAGACSKKQPPVARPTPPPATAGAPGGVATRPPAPPEPVAEPTAIPADPDVTSSSDLSARSVDAINKESPFQAVFFAYDSEEIDAQGQAALQNNAQILKQYGSWVVTIEGHCDERGTPEYNLALGERRAIAARDYLMALGIAPDRLKTVSYGNEFPFDPAHTEEAYSKNRRAHFVVTAK